MFDFVRAFEPGFTLPGQSFYVVTAGDVLLPSGRIVACDPLVCPETDAFSRTVAPGTYPVLLSIAVGSNGDERIGFAMVRFGEAPVVAWEPAVLPGQDVSTLGEGETFGYGVDAGLGCFMDVETQSLLLAAIDALEPECNYYDDVLDGELGKNYKDTRDWIMHRPEKDAPHNVAVFSSGWGDGCYSSWFGLDASGNPVVLVTDFGVAELPEN